MSSSPTPDENSTLAALGLEKPAPVLPAQQQAQREIQDTVALAWLALSDLQPAPDTIWQNIQSRIQPAPSASVHSGPRRSRLLAWSGWAAAALVALTWWFAPPTSPLPPPVSVTHPVFNPRPGLAPPSPAVSPQVVSAPSATSSGQALREELLALRKRISGPAFMDENQPGQHRPVILQLRPPGHKTTPASHARSAAHLQQVLLRALQRDLLLQTPSDPTALVLESGWPQSSWIAGQPAQPIRHLNFPAAHWQALGLWKAPDDHYYDPNTTLTWSPAPDGLGYLGTLTPTVPDPGGYQISSPDSPAYPVESPPVPPAPEPASPSGYLISEPNTEKATLLLTDIPPSAPGEEQFVIASTANGQTQTYPLQPGDFITTDSQHGSTSLSITLSSLSLTGSFTDFSLIRESGTSRSVVLTTGGP